MFNAMRPSFSWSLTLVTCPPLLVFNAFGLLVAAHPCHLTVSPMHLAHIVWTWSGLTPHIDLSPLRPAHLALSPARRILLTSLGPSWVLPAHTHLVSLCICLLPVHLAHFPMSPPPHVLLTSLGPGGSLPMCMPLSPVHLTHLPMSPPPHVLPTSLASSHVSQVGLLPVHAAHLTTSQLGLTPVSQWMVCMARCGEVCNRGK